MSKVATIGELECADTTIVASLHNLLRNLYIAMIEHGNHTRLLHLLQYLYLVKFHNSQFIIHD